MKKNVPTSRKQAKRKSDKGSELFWKNQLKAMGRFDQNLVIAWK
jgi:hypothetical protein